MCCIRVFYIKFLHGTSLAVMNHYIPVVHHNKNVCKELAAYPKERKTEETLDIDGKYLQYSYKHMYCTYIPARHRHVRNWVCTYIKETEERHK